MTQRRTFAECCVILEIEPASTPSQVQRGYQRMVMLWHPDRFQPGTALKAEAEERIKAINEAYAVLQEPREPSGLPMPSPPPRPDPFAGQPMQPKAPEPRAPSSAFLVLAACVAAALALSWTWTRQAPLPAVGNNPQPGSPGGSISALAGKNGPAVPPPEIEPAPPMIFHRPVVVIFSPSRQEQEESSAVRAASIANFLQNANSIREKIQRQRPDLPIQMTDAEAMVCLDTTIHRRQTCGFGYILFSPPKQPKVMEGIQAIDEMLAMVDTLFPHGGVSDLVEPAS